MLPLVPPTALYHTGIVVEDLDEAMEEFGNTGGLEFRSHVVDVGYRSGRGERREVPLRVAYSVQGPVHVELIEAQAGTAWEAPHGPHLHHLGFWAEDLGAAVRGAEALGFLRVASGIGPDGGSDPSRFSYLVGPVGIRLEFVDARLAPVLSEWLGGGDWRLPAP